MNISSEQQQGTTMLPTTYRTATDLVDSNERLALSQRERTQVLIVSQDLENCEGLTAILNREGCEHEGVCKDAPEGVSFEDLDARTAKGTAAADVKKTCSGHASIPRALTRNWVCAGALSLRR